MSVAFEAAFREVGTTVTVRESISLVGGGDVRVAPQSAKPAAGLVWLSSSLINEDGTTPAFDAPLALTEGGNVTIVGTYRLTRCPDLLPTSWPTPVKIVGGDWKRTFTRSQVPLRTARAICPRADSSAKELRGLSGVMLRSRAAVVRLRWEGKSPLVIEVVGAASEVAVLTRSSACKGECVAQIKRNSTARLALRPVDRCAIGGRSNEHDTASEQEQSSLACRKAEWQPDGERLRPRAGFQGVYSRSTVTVPIR